MAQVAWSDPALNDLEAIAEYIALDNPEAAAVLVRRVFAHVDQLRLHPRSGTVPRELKSGRYRQIIEPPCRIFYRYDAKRVVVVHVMRAERKLRASRLKPR
jgi:toxin ParE1/3/4